MKVTITSKDVYSAIGTSVLIAVPMGVMYTSIGGVLGMWVVFTHLVILATIGKWFISQKQTVEENDRLIIVAAEVFTTQSAIYNVRSTADEKVVIAKESLDRLSATLRTEILGLVAKEATSQAQALKPGSAKIQI